MSKAITFTKREKGSIKVEHFSTPSLIKLTLSFDDEVEQGVFIKSTDSIWLEYSDFDNLTELLTELSIPDKD